MEPLFEYVLKSSGILAIFYLVYRFFLQKETLFVENRRFLFIGMLCAMIGPFITIPIYLEMSPITFSQGSVNMTSIGGTVTAIGIDLWQIAMIFYSAGLLFLFGKLSLQVYSLRAILSNSTNKLKKDGLIYVETQRDLAPFSFFNYIVYNPSLYDPEELESILAHERAHCSQKHSIDIVLSHLITIILWINPLSYLYRNTIRQNLEFLADASATITLPSLKTYQYTLLKVSGHSLPLTVVNQFYNSLIKKRIVMLQKSQSKKTNMLKSALVLPALALFLYSFNTTEVYIPATESDDLSWFNLDTNKIEIKINKDTSDAELEKIKQDMANEGVDFSYTVVRNASKEITSLDIEMNSKKGSDKELHGSSSFDNDGEPIDPVTIVFDPEGQMMFMGGDGDEEMEFGGKAMKNKMVWSSNKNVEITNEDGKVIKKVWVTKDENEEDGKHVIIKKIKGGDEESEIHEGHEGKKFKIRVKGSDDENENVIIKRIKVGDDDEHDVKIIKKRIKMGDDGEEMELHEGGDHEEHIEIIKSKGGKGKNVFIMKDSDDDEDIEIIEGDGEAFFFLDSEKGENPLYVLDGKVVSQKKFRALSPKEIATVNVIKGEKATEKYGKKAKDGVVEVTTKKKNK